MNHSGSTRGTWPAPPVEAHPHPEAAQEVDREEPREHPRPRGRAERRERARRPVRDQRARGDVQRERRPVRVRDDSDEREHGGDERDEHRPHVRELRDDDAGARDAERAAAVDCGVPDRPPDALAAVVERRGQQRRRGDAEREAGERVRHDERAERERGGRERERGEHHRERAAGDQDDARAVGAVREHAHGRRRDRLQEVAGALRDAERADGDADGLVVQRDDLLGGVGDDVQQEVRGEEAGAFAVADGGGERLAEPTESRHRGVSWPADREKRIRGSSPRHANSRSAGPPPRPMLGGVRPPGGDAGTTVARRTAALAAVPLR